MRECRKFCKFNICLVKEKLKPGSQKLFPKLRNAESFTSYKSDILICSTVYFRFSVLLMGGTRSSKNQFWRFGLQFGLKEARESKNAFFAVVIDGAKGQKALEGEKSKAEAKAM